MIELHWVYWEKCLTTLHPSEYHRLLTSRSREPKHKILVFNGKLFSGKCTYTSVLDLKLRDVLLPCFPESNPKQWKRRDNVSGWGRKKKLFFKKQLMPKIRAPWFHLFNTDASSLNFWIKWTTFSTHLGQFSRYRTVFPHLHMKRYLVLCIVLIANWYLITI